jgi:hypothetical protein
MSRLAALHRLPCQRQKIVQVEHDCRLGEAQSAFTLEHEHTLGR